MEREKALQIFKECGGEPTSKLQEDLLFKFAEAVEAQVLREFSDALVRYQAPLDNAMFILDTMHRSASTVIAWRDKHKLKKGDEIEVWKLLELAKDSMEIVGWYEEPKREETPFVKA